MTTALVTGASGFIGSTLIQELNQMGVHVYAVLRQTSSTENLEGLQYERVDGDILNAAGLAQELRSKFGSNPKIDWVFHLAGVTAAPNKAAYFRANADGCRNFAQALDSAGIEVSRLVAVSSLAASGPAATSTPVDETVACAPVSLYGKSKLAGEEALLKYRDRFPLVFVRPPMVYGPRDQAVFTMIQTVSKGLIPLLPSQGVRGKVFSCIHAFDLARGLILAAQASPEKVPSGEVFFLAEDGKYTDRELFNTIATILGKRAVALPVPKLLVVVLAYLAGFVGRITGKMFPLNPDKLNEIMPAYWICSNEKAKRLLGFQERYDFASGMRDSIEWYRKQGWIH